MPLTIASEILDEARGTYLNDPSAGTYTNAKLLPLLKTSHNFLQSALEAIGAQTKNEEVTKVISAGVDEYVSLPSDFVIPRRCQERLSGSSDEFRDMKYAINIPQITAGATLSYWAWRVDRLLFLPATQDREVKVFYQRSYPVVNVATDIVLGPKAEQYLAAKVAALAYMFLANSPTLASVAEGVARQELDEILGIQIKINQAAPVRRKPYMPFRWR